MNTPVSFELAKLLKEKGFDNVCYSYYENERLYKGPFGTTIINSEYGSKSSVKEILNSDFELKCYKIRKKEYLAAPTISDIVIWLYEKYKIWINVSGDCDYKFRFEIHTWNWYENEKSHRLSHIVLGESFWDTSSKPFTSPTEAYEAAIEYTLKNLIYK